MALKLTAFTLLVMVLVLSAHGKRLKDMKKLSKNKSSDVTTNPIYYDKVVFNGYTTDCNIYKRFDKKERSSWCNCPFVFCTGAQRCDDERKYGLSCWKAHHRKVDLNNLSSADCECKTRDV